MSKVTRYVLSQLVLTFLITLVGMTFVMVFGIMAKQGMRQGLGLESILRLLPYALPSALRFSVPASLLLAACSVYGRMSSDNEIMAAKSLGISPRVLLLPALMLGLVVSLGMIWLNDVAITWGTSGMQTVIAESVEEVVFRLLKTERSFRNGHFEIYVKQVRGRTLIEPRLEVRDRALSLHAREAVLETDLENQMLKIFLTDCTIKQGGRLEYADSRTIQQEIPLTQATKKETGELRVSELGLAHISDETVRQQMTIQSIEQTLTARAAFQLITGDFSSLASGAKQPDGNTWDGLHKQHSEAKYRLNRLLLEPYRRCAEGFSCLFIVIVGAPLAIKMRTTNFFTTFAMCFFPVLCIYYPVLQWTVESVKDALLPPYAVWLGNGLLLCVGSWLTRNIVRY